MISFGLIFVLVYEMKVAYDMVKLIPVYINSLEYLTETELMQSLNFLAVIPNFKSSLCIINFYMISIYLPKMLPKLLSKSFLFDWWI